MISYNFGEHDESQNQSAFFQILKNDNSFQYSYI